MARRCVVVANKRNGGPGLVLAVPSSTDEFLKQAGEKLGISAKKAFTENGALLDDVSLIRDDEKLYVSSGEGFWKYDDSRVRVYKIAVLGAGGVGKSCLSLRYVKNSFVDVYDPTIEDAFRHQTMIDGITCMLDILDTAGQEDMKMLRRQWVQDRDGFVLVYSMVERRSFDELQHFVNLIKSIKQKTVPLVVCANKSDMADKRAVSAQEGIDLAKANQGEYIEASARAGTNVNECFELLVRRWNKLEGIGTEDGAATPARKKRTCIIL